MKLGAALGWMAEAWPLLAKLAKAIVILSLTNVLHLPTIRLALTNTSPTHLPSTVHR